MLVPFSCPVIEMDQSEHIQLSLMRNGTGAIQCDIAIIRLADVLCQVKSKPEFHVFNN